MSSAEVKKVLSEGAIAICIKYAGAFLSIAMFAALTKAMGADNFGYYGIAFSVGSIMAVIGSFGWHRLTIRFGTKYLAEEDEKSLSSLISVGYKLVVMGSLFLALLIFVFVYLWPTVGAPHHIAASAIFVIALALSELTIAVFRIQGRLLSAFLPRDILWRVAVTLIALYTLLDWTPALSGSSGVWVSALSLLIIVIGQTALSPMTKFQDLATDVGKSEWDNWRSPALHLWGTTIINKSGPPIAVITMTYIMPPIEVGAFFLASRLADATALSVRSLALVVSPQLGRLTHLKDYGSLQRVVTASALISFVMALGSALFYILFGDWVLQLFANEFSSAKPVLVVLSIGLVVTASLGPGGQLMTMMDLESYSLKYSIASNFIGIFSIVVLGVFFGPIGAALGLVTSKILNFSLRAFRIWTHSNILLFLPMQIGRILLGKYTNSIN